MQQVEVGEKSFGKLVGADIREVNPQSYKIRAIKNDFYATLLHGENVHLAEEEAKRPATKASCIGIAQVRQCCSAAAHGCWGQRILKQYFLGSYTRDLISRQG